MSAQVTRPQPDHINDKGSSDVDRTVWRSVDPSENVKALTEAANQRQDDLREKSEELIKLRLECLEKNIALRAEYAREVNSAESRRVNEQLSLRSTYDERLALAEAKRIDAIRAVDVNAVSVASQRAADQASVLAAQVLQSAEALRTLVSTTAATAAQSQSQSAATFSTRLTTLEQASYQTAGKQSFTDPAMTELLAKVSGLLESRAGGTGRGSGQLALTNLLFGSIAAIGVIGGLAFAFLSP